MRLARLLTLLLLSSLCLSAFGQVEIQILPPQIWSGPSADTLGFLMPTRANNGAKWVSNATAKAAILPAGTNGQTLRYNGTTLTASSLFTNDGTNLAIPGFTTPGYIANDASGNLSTVTAVTASAALNYWILSGGDVYRASGNVGIGISSPTQMLDVNGNIRARTNLISDYDVYVSGSVGFRLNRTGNGTVFGAYDAAGTTRYWQVDHVNGGLWCYLQSMGAYSMVLDGSGNLGIGTTSPSQQLHVVGNARVTGAYYDSANSAGTSGYLLKSTGSATSWVDPATLSVQNIYTANGTLTGNRTMSMGGYNLTLSSASVGTASGEAHGLVLTNTTAAASSAPQNSSALVWSGQSWLTGSSASQNVKFLSHYVSQEGTSSPAGYFALESSLNGGAYSGGLFRVDVLGRTSIGNSAIVSGADLATSRNVSDPTADNYGFYIYKTTTKSTGGNQSATFGVRSEVTTNSNNISDAGETIGVLGKSVGTSTGTSGTTAAASGGVFLGSYSGLGTASSLYGVRASVEAYRNSATVPVVTNAYGVYVSGANPGAGGLATVTNSYGLHIGTLLESTVNSTYSIYQTNSSYLNYLNGKLGLGTTGPDRRLDVLDASNPQLRLTYTDGSVYTDFKTTSAGGMEISPSGGRIDLIPGADGAVYNARRQVEAPTDVAMTGNATLTAGRKVYHLSGTISAGNTWTLTLPTSASMIDGEVIEIVNGITGVATATVQIAPNSGQDLIGGMSSLDFSNSVGAYNRKSIKLMFKTGGTWYALAQGNY